MLEQRTALVTGAAQGLGRAIALTLAEEGAEVIVADLNRSPADEREPTDKLVDEQTAGEFLETDVADPESTTNLLSEVETKFGNLDILVNNAGIHSIDAPVLDTDLEDWERIIAVNLTGTFLCTKASLPLLLEDGGSIVNIASVAGQKGSHGVPAYCSSKAGVANFTRQLVADYAENGIRANAVLPGFIDTSMTSQFRDTKKGKQLLSGIPNKRAGDPQHVANAVRFLVSDRAEYINGHSLVVDGGLTSTYY